MKKAGEIEYLDFKSGEDTSPCLLFFHGYGAHAQDLSGFHTLKLPVSCRWIFPNGPLKLGAPYDIFGGRAWFSLKVNDNQLFSDEYSLLHLKKHCQQLFTFIKSLNLSSDKMILGGFSQGAIMALNLALRMNPPPQALVIMSGALFPQEILDKEKHTFSKKSSFFQCHGKTDPLLLYSEAKKVCDFLHDLEWKGHFISFNSGHEIPHAVLLQVQEFISHQLS